MRVALRIAYDGRAFYGHQRQPDRRTVEGECLVALRSARMIRNVQESFFRSASRTDRGVSAVGNVIAFNTGLSPDAVVGAFNDKARDVWAWAIAEVAMDFHPRHAVARTYRYHLLDDVSPRALADAGQIFVGRHDFRSFASEPSRGLRVIDEIDVSRIDGLVRIDVRAQSFLRGMVRRIVAAMVAHAKGEARLDELRAALDGAKRDFGAVPPQPLVLLEVRYDFPFRVVASPKARDEWAALDADMRLRMHFLEALRLAVGSGTRNEVRTERRPISVEEALEKG